MKRAIFPGTFDPFTLGHFDILKRSKQLFDEIIVGIGKNSEKKTMFSLKERVEFIEKVVKDDNKIKVMSYDGLTIDRNISHFHNCLYFTCNAVYVV